MCSPKLIVAICCSSVKRSRSVGMEVDQPNRAGEDRRRRRVAEETRVATASPEAGTLAGGTARRPRRDGRGSGGVPAIELTTSRRGFQGYQAIGSRDFTGRRHRALRISVWPRGDTAPIVRRPATALKQCAAYCARPRGPLVADAPDKRMRPQATTRDSMHPSDAEDLPAMAPLYPLKFDPILRRLIWGGRRLGTVLRQADRRGRAITPRAGRSPTIATRSVSSPKARSPAPACATWSATRGGELARVHGLAGRDQFPLLVKFIDAREVLSVQVHPDDEKGRRLADDNGKTETWVIVDAEPGSLIYRGPEAGRDARAVRPGDRAGRGRAAAAPVRAQAGRLRHDRGRHRPRHRRRGAAGRDPADVGRHVPRGRLGPRRARRQASRAARRARRWSRPTSPRARRSPGPRRRADHALGNIRERLVELPVLRPRAAAADAGRSRSDRPTGSRS